ncbi:MAG: hypothetical protein KDE46_06135 [Caldilineaceae bacterium]|nr:hypothetical protein [Caldilineaceae bacterium]
MLDLLQKEPLRLHDMQTFHTKLDAAKGFDTDFIKNTAYFTAEVGEMINAYRQYIKIIHRAQANGAHITGSHPNGLHIDADGAPTMDSTPINEDVDHAHEHLAEELADCLAYVVKLANYADVDLEAAYVRKMTRNVSRQWSGIDLSKSTKESKEI